MKRKTAKEILAESFREVARKKPADKITVRDITQNCGYSTATFYRQFKDKYDLIAWDYARQLGEIISAIDGSEHAWTKTLLTAAKWFYERREYLQNLLMHTEGLDAFIDYMRQINYESLRACILKVTGQTTLSEKTELYIRVYVFGTVQLTSEWILHQCQTPPEEIAEIYKNALPGPLLAYLTQE